MAFAAPWLRARVSPLKIALLEMILPELNNRGLGIRMSWVEIFEKLISGGTSIRHPRVMSLLFCFILFCLKIKLLSNEEINFDFQVNLHLYCSSFQNEHLVKFNNFEDS